MYNVFSTVPVPTETDSLHTLLSYWDVTGMQHIYHYAHGMFAGTVPTVPTVGSRVRRLMGY